MTCDETTRLSEKLMKLRRKKGLTQLEEADALGISRQAISKWESGLAAPSMDNLKKISEIYGVSTDFLLKGGSAAAPVSDTLTKQVVSAAPPAAGEPERYSRTPLQFRSTQILTVALLIALIIIAVLLRTVLEQARKLEEYADAEIIPIEEMETDFEDDGYPVITFDLEPLGSPEGESGI